jgi:predicted nucleic acid-binding OB-fold protein
MQVDEEEVKEEKVRQIIQEREEKLVSFFNDF